MNLKLYQLSFCLLIALLDFAALAGPSVSVDTEQPMGPAPSSRDLQIATAIYTELSANPLTDTYTFQVDCLQGIVTLIGTVTTPQEKTAAIRSAARIPGILKIIDKIQVKPDPPSGEVSLGDRIDHKIDEDPIFSPDDIVAARVEGRNVDIGGIVGNWKQHHQATHDAFLAGAKTVSNHIRVVDDIQRSHKKFYYTHDPFH